MNSLRSRTHHRQQPATRDRVQAFSVIELLVVIAILAIMAALFIRATSPNEAARQVKNCQKNLQRLFLAMEIYATDHRNDFPAKPGARTAGEALNSLVPRYTADTASFICPAVHLTPPPSGESIAKHKLSYAYYMGRRKEPPATVLLSDEQVDASAKPVGAAVFSSTGAAPGNNHGRLGGNFLFTDGHAETTPPRAPFSLVFTQGVVLLNP